jgi:hypothetical protein
VLIFSLLKYIYKKGTIQNVQRRRNAAASPPTTEPTNTAPEKVSHKKTAGTRNIKRHE